MTHRTLMIAASSLAVLGLSLPLVLSGNIGAPPWIDVSEEANAAWPHDFAVPYDDPLDLSTPLQMSGGVAAGDVDNDGDTDLYLITGGAFPNRLLLNDGNGPDASITFTEAAQSWGVAMPGEESTAPLFADIDSDGHLDLLVGGVTGTGLKLFRNTGQGRFELDPTAGGITQDTLLQNDMSIAAGDPDGDGDLDLYIGHWGTSEATTHFWINTGNGTFIPGDQLAGVGAIYAGLDWSFAPSFVDVNGDGRQDLLITSDFETSHTLINLDGIRFENRNVGVIDDRAGMGSAPADFDNDGDVDWFVTAIFYTNPIPGHGNRLYRNDGEGSFEDATEEAGVRDGAWGWSACAADFDNNGWLDLYHVNGMPFIQPPAEDFLTDRSRAFMNQGDGVFDSLDLAGLAGSDRQGRGVVCFDADGDGRLDVFSANVLGDSTLYQNTRDPLLQGEWLQLRLRGEPSNPSAVGAVIRVTQGELTQTRQLTIGSQYQSQNPLVQHFGLGGVLPGDTVDRVEVHWPHGGTTLLEEVPVDQRLELSAEDADIPPLTIQPGMTSAWYDLDRNGEGFLLEVLPGGAAVVYWFTYDREGNQDWYIAVGEVKGRRILFPELLRVSGGEFGPGFDPDNVSRAVVGTAAFTWTDCDSGFMDWTLTPGLSSRGFGRQTLSRLTRAGGLNCLNPGEPPPPMLGAPPPPDFRWLTGSWYDPTHDGEGYVLEVLADGRPIVYWFSFDTAGNRRWYFGVGEFIDGVATFESMLTSEGGLFGRAFDPDLVSFPAWGRLELDLSCEGGTARWTATEDGFPNGTLALQRLTQPDGVDCP
ncbi:MAG: CRTAC1 family protein [Pseudomonadota bacterium]